MDKPYPRITIYTRCWFGSVMRVKHWLERRGIAYREIDISQDAEVTRHVEALSGDH